MNTFILALNVTLEKPESGQIFPLCVFLLFLLGCVRTSFLTLKFYNLIRMGYVFVLRFLYQIFLTYIMLF